MKILVDTREQKPLEFYHYYLTDEMLLEKEKLDAGDYRIADDRCHWVFERKSIQDLISTLKGGHARFKREIERAKKAGDKLVVIVEGTLGDVIKGFEVWRTVKGRRRKTKIKGESAMRALITLKHKYDVEHVFCKDREEMITYIYEFYKSWKKNNDGP